MTLGYYGSLLVLTGRFDFVETVIFWWIASSVSWVFFAWARRRAQSIYRWVAAGAPTALLFPDIMSSRHMAMVRGWSVVEWVAVWALLGIACVSANRVFAGSRRGFAASLVSSAVAAYPCYLLVRRAFWPGL